MTDARYIRASRGTEIFNPIVTGLTRIGVSIYGSRVLAVRGRKSGEWRTVPVNLLTYKQGVDAFRVTDRLSESDRAALMGGTLQRVYNWSPTKS